MMSILRRHHIATIVSLAVVTSVLVFKFQYFPQLQFIFLASLVIIYLFWAFIFHYRDKSLTTEVAAEYLLTALLAIIVLYGILV